MNPNLIIDEEAFFAVFGRISSSTATSYFAYNLLNSMQLPLLANPQTGPTYPALQHAAVNNSR